MANIHRLGDVSNEGRTNRTGSFGPYSTALQDEPIRCIDLFLPGFTFKCLILWITVVQIVIYVVTVFYGSVELQPTTPTLRLFGSSYGPCLQAGEVYRFITPMFLHGSIWHILMNSFFQLRMGFPLEARLGVAKFALLYVASGIGGNCLSPAWYPCKDAVGASTAGFGLIGISFADMALLWHVIQHRDRMIFNVVFFLVITLTLSINPGANIDWRGHLGGAIVGFSLGMIYSRDMENKPSWYMTGFWAAVSSLFALYASTIAIIFAIPMEPRGCSGCW